MMSMQKPKPFTPAVDKDKVTDLIEARHTVELDDLEEDFQDDPFLEEYRLAQRKSWSHGCRIVHVQIC